MKKVLVGLLMACLIGAVAWASGPLVNFGIEPAEDAYAILGFGWDFDSWAIIGQKEAFNTWYGTWSLLALWTPDVGFADVRFGPKIDLLWSTTGLQYENVAIILGIEKFWGIAGVFAQLEVNTAYGLIPVVGLELHFDIPEPVEP
jgi:hypothetical protein